MGKLCTLIAVVAAAVLVSGSAPQEAEAQTVGWTCQPGFGECIYEEWWGGYSHAGQGTANAVVGLPFQWKLEADCHTGGWNLEGAEIQTGRLPPGLELQPSAPFGIVGVPTRAGSFSFQFFYRGLYCEGGDNHNGDWGSTIVVTGS